MFPQAVNGFCRYAGIVSLVGEHCARYDPMRQEAVAPHDERVQCRFTIDIEREKPQMSLYIKTEDYRKHGISKYSDLALIRAVVQKELSMDRVFVSFVNKHEYIRVDFLSPRPPRRPKKRRYRREAAEKSQQA